MSLIHMCRTGALYLTRDRIAYPYPAVTQLSGSHLLPLSTTTVHQIELDRGVL